ncbi:MAG TPA: carboxypeptidase-like regulatory domain-containing protein [Gemmataceae bacterium]|nr:carboxypeptidase-like regulatory domain-containing protein [Gemmataceae bacterium]
MSTRRLARHLLWLLALPAGCANPRSVAVLVRDAETKLPVSGAEVRLSSAGSDQTAAGTTGPDGVARIAAKPPGETGVLAEVHAPGYLTGGKDVTGLFTHPHSPAEPAVVEVFAGPRPGVELVLPAGYRGLVRAEVRVRDDAPPGGREFSFVVPASGVVEVTGPAILEQPPGPEYRARYADGTTLSGAAPDEAVGFRWLWAEGRDEVFVVGTKADWAEARKALGHDPGPGSRPDSGGAPTGGRGRGGRRGGGGR